MSSFSDEAFSLEFFPPRDQASRERLVGTAKQLMAMHARYISVTFGAGGATRDGTAETVSMFAQLGCEAAPHLSCSGAGSAPMIPPLAQYKKRGIRRIAALRGDLPSGMGGND